MQQVHESEKSVASAKHIIQDTQCLPTLCILHYAFYIVHYVFCIPANSLLLAPCSLLTVKAPCSLNNRLFEVLLPSLDKNSLFKLIFGESLLDIGNLFAVCRYTALLNGSAGIAL